MRQAPPEKLLKNFFSVRLGLHKHRPPGNPLGAGGPPVDLGWRIKHLTHKAQKYGYAVSLV
jgi:hypothetical protein